MTDNEKLARFQGKCYHVSDWGQTNCKYCGRTNDPRYFDFDSINPDYLNDDAAAMSLLDTLVEKKCRPELWHNEKTWQFEIWERDDGITDSGELLAVAKKTTRRAGVCAAVLEMIGKEEVRND